MRTARAWTLAAPLMLLAQAAPASAQNYPWCAQYGEQSGARNCGFSTYEQCRAALSGNGGYCIENPMYRPAAGTQALPRRSRRPPG